MLEPTISQKYFIDSKKDLLKVQAGPGSGKTTTLVEYLKKIEIPKGKKILVSSFSNVGVNTIKRKYKDYLKNDEIIFLTLDSFFNNYIWKYYFKRIIKKISSYLEVEVDLSNINFSDLKKKFQKEKHLNQYRKSSYEDLEKLTIKEIFNNWVNEIKNKKFISGSFSDYLILFFLKSDVDFKNSFFSMWERIVLDEAQDTSVDKIKILIEFNKKYNSKITLIGDQNQMIYRFLNADFSFYSSLKGEGFHEIYLNDNFRIKNNDNLKNFLVEYDKSIANLKDKESIIKLIKFGIAEKAIEVKEKIDDIIQEASSSGCLILTRKNEEIKTIYNTIIEKMGSDFNFLPSYDFHEQELDDFEGKKEVARAFLVSRLKFKGCKDKIDLNVIQILEEKFQLNYESNIKTNLLSLLKKMNKIESWDEYCIEIKNLIEMDIKLDINEESEQNIKQFISELLPENDKKIMTLFKSKGLESDYIIIPLSVLCNQIKSLKVNNLFVMFSRAIKKVFIVRDL